MQFNPPDSHFIQFLQDELAVSAAEITMALKYRELDHDPLAIILWQYGFISLEQLAKIFDWLDNRFQPSLAAAHVAY